MLRLIAAVMTAALLLAGCGGDDDGESAATTADVSSDDDTTTTDADDGDDDADETTTTSGESASGSGSMPNPASINDFCGVFQIFDTVEDPFEVAEQSDDPADMADAMRQGFSMMTGLFQRAAQLAPNEIKPDMALLARGISEYEAILAEYDYDFMALGMASMEDPTLEERLEILDSGEFEAASTRIEEYVLAECGIELD